MLSFICISFSLLPLLVYCAPTHLDDQVGTDQVNFVISNSTTSTTSGVSSPSQNLASTRPFPLVMAYYPDWAGTSHPPEKVPFSLYDWIDFAFALPTARFDIAWDSPDTPNLLRRLVTAAHAHGTKVKCSVGGWTGSKYFSQAVATEENRYLFANNILRVYKSFHLDGIDLDWEYPGREGAAGNQINPQDSKNFLLFLHCLRSVLPSSARITAAAQTVPFTDASGQPTKDVSQFAAVLNWLLLMNYDVWGSSSTPGPNAPLYDGCRNSTQPESNAVAAYYKWTAAGFPASQLVLGAPTYGYISKSNAPGLRQRRSTHTSLAQTIQPRKGNSGPMVKVKNEDGGSNGQVSFRELVKQGALLLTRPADANTPAFFDGAGGFERHWDACSSTPYLRSTSAGQIITYDDPKSLGQKAQFASKVGMLGVNLFDTHGDTDQYDLIFTVRKALGV